MQSDPYRQTKNLLICRSSLLDGGHLYSMGDLAKGWKEKKSGWALLTDCLKRLKRAEQEGKHAGTVWQHSAGVSSLSAHHQPQPYLRCFVPSLLFVASVTCCLRMLSSSAFRSRPGQAQILASKHRRPSTWPLGGDGDTRQVRNNPEKKKRRILTGGFIAYSLVSKVTMMRIGRLFIPPTQLELHIKLYKIVVNSVPTWVTTQQWVWVTLSSSSSGHRSKGAPVACLKLLCLMSPSGDRRRTHWKIVWLKI